MNLKRLTWFIKASLAGLFALLVMTLISYFYFNMPIHNPNTSGATDFNWTQNSFYIQCKEGFSYGKTNNEGYMNTFDYEDGMTIDVLVMGSSHMEAANVAMKDSTTSILNESLDKKTVYNIGVSGHTFSTCCSNLESALIKYHPQEYVVIEPSVLEVTQDELKSILDRSIPELADHSDGIIGILSKNPFLRLTYHQLKGLFDLTRGGASSTEQSKSTNIIYSLEKVLTYISDIANQYSSKLIIVYHPSTLLNADGSLTLQKDLDYIKMFSELCDKHGIIFLDMSEKFTQEYITKHKLPYGFSNTSVGRGHLNKYGHAMIAEELYKLIN